MKTTLTNIQLRPLVNPETGESRPSPLISALNELMTRPVGVRTGMKIRGIVRTINQQAKDVEEERQRLIDLHVKRDGDGNPLYQNEAQTILQVNGTFNQEFAELMEMDFETEALVIGDLEGIGTVTPQLLLNLEDLLLDEEQPANTTKEAAAVKRKGRK